MKKTLRLLQVTTGSPMGSIALETGGLLIDHGWMRILGAGAEAMSSTLASWNGLEATREIEPIDDALVVANDAVGGVFALNGGAFDGEPARSSTSGDARLAGHVDGVFQSFLQWACAGDLSRFYDELRWEGWVDDVARASPEQGIALYPPPFAEEGKPVAQARRELVPVAQLCEFYRECARQLAELPEGAPFRFEFSDFPR